MRAKLCVSCGQDLPAGARADHRYCGVRCRVRAHRLRSGAGTRQQRRDRRVIDLQATVVRLRRERAKAAREAERLRTAAATAQRPAVKPAHTEQYHQREPSLIEHNLRLRLAELRRSNEDKEEELQMLRAETRVLSGQAPGLVSDLQRQVNALQEIRDDLQRENAQLRSDKASLQTDLVNVRHGHAQAITQATAQGKQAALNEMAHERNMQKMRVQTAEARAKHAAETLREDHSALAAVTTVCLTALGVTAQQIEARRATKNEEPPPTASDPTPVKVQPSKPTPSPDAKQGEHAPSLDDEAAWEALRTRALRQGWTPLADTLFSAVSSELAAESAVADCQAVKGQIVTVRRLKAGEDGKRQIQIATLQMRWAFHRQSPTGLNARPYWDRGRYKLDWKSELEMAKQSRQRRAEWARRLAEMG